MVKATYIVYTPNNGGETVKVTRGIYQLVDGEKNYIYYTEDTNVPNNTILPKTDKTEGWNINFGSVGFPTSGTLYIEFTTPTGASKTFTVNVLPLSGIENVILHDTLKIAYIAPNG